MDEVLIANRQTTKHRSSRLICGVVMCCLVGFSVSGCSRDGSQEYREVTETPSEEQLIANQVDQHEPIDPELVSEPKATTPVDANEEASLQPQADQATEEGSTETTVATIDGPVSAPPDAEPTPPSADVEAADKTKKMQKPKAEPSEVTDVAVETKTPRNRDAQFQVGLSAEEQIARMRAEAMGLPYTPENTGPAKPIKLLIPDNEFSIDPQHDALRISFDDFDLLKVLNMEPVPIDAVDHMPEWLKSLDGKRIVLRGWMYPPGREKNISTFMFVRDSGLCCFGSNPKVYDKLAVTMREGVTTDHVQGRAFDVAATFKIEPDTLDDPNKLAWLYHLNDAIVIDE